MAVKFQLETVVNARICSVKLGQGVVVGITTAPNGEALYKVRTQGGVYPLYETELEAATGKALFKQERKVVTNA